MRSIGVRRYAVVLLVVAVTAACGAAPSSTAPTPAATAPTLAPTTPPAAATASTAPASTASPTPIPTAAALVIEMGDHFFDPAQLTVKVGTKVTWRSVGQSTHDLAARDGSFSLGAMSFGQTFSFAFTKAGRFPYVCMQHEGDGMVGEVIVVE